ncbi:MAG: hypothetical protein ABFQ62_03625 [Patescibacteria group bacterium]
MKWVLAFAFDKQDENTVALNFVKHFTQAIPDAKTLELLNKYTAEKNEPEVFACTILFTDGEEFKEFEAWKNTK